MTALASPAAVKPTVPPKIDLAKAQKMANRVLLETSKIRQLPVRHGVKTKVMTSSEVEKMLGGKATSELTNQQILASELFVRQLGLAPANFQLKSTYIKMMGEQIGGFYVAKSNTFTTTDRVDPLQLETVMAHELTHALQDQYYDLSKLEHWPDHAGDARLAMSALVEGDATYVMSKYMAQNPVRFLGMMFSSLKAQGASPTFDAAPRILRDGVTFPYLSGLRFVTDLYRDGGWSEVDAAYERMPKSTEQILHFDKYLDDEKPTVIKPLDLTATLGPGWKLLDHDVNGEFGLFSVVVEHLGDEAAAKAAAAGWGGDRYYIYSGSQNATLVVQDTRWDSLSDANQWRSAYAHSAANRFGTKLRDSNGVAVWASGKNGIWLAQKGNRVLILEGTVGSFNPNSILSKLWN